ncbi:VOC family protein [Enterococcus sp. HY326]|uniref:VOC family protein n=1 Tax=Enterococcus sp. HY326 TaxID=2971265 RepID=UPI00223F657D|nr:VOC family protein [Enterococcus sp. HY326]
MTTFALSPATKLKSLAIRVKNRDLEIKFFQTLGFYLKREENELAIFGTVDKDSELLVLEESPRADEFAGQPRKMARVSMIIPSEAEFAEIYARLKKAEYPIKEALENHGRLGFVVTDPEGNEFEIFCSEHKEGQRETTENLSEAAILAQAKGEMPYFSKEVRFDKIHLHVLDVAQQMDFYQDILGLTAQDENHGFFVLNEGHFQVGLHQGDSQPIRLSTKEVHGLDFLKFDVDAASFDALKEHLQALQQDFFIDGKEQIITIYDTLGLEWWFDKVK